MQLKLANEYGGVKEAQLTKTTKVSMHRAAHTYYAARHSCVAGAAAAHSGGITESSRKKMRLRFEREKKNQAKVLQATVSVSLPTRSDLF